MLGALFRRAGRPPWRMFRDVHDSSVQAWLEDPIKDAINMKFAKAGNVTHCDHSPPASWRGAFSSWRKSWKLFTVSPGAFFRAPPLLRMSRCQVLNQRQHLFFSVQTNVSFDGSDAVSVSFCLPWRLQQDVHVQLPTQSRAWSDSRRVRTCQCETRFPRIFPSS